MNHSQLHLPLLDGIRGIAILAVFLFHCLGVAFGFDNTQWDGLLRDFDISRYFLALYPFTYGFAGVPIFFVVSGFCIHLSHYRSKEKGWANFASRRFFRIYPPYLLAIFTFFFVLHCESFERETFSRTAQFVTHLLAIHNLHQHTFFGINPSLWSIAVEIQLYALFPLLFLIAAKAGWRRGLMVAAVFELFIRGYASAHEILTKEPLPRYFVSSPFAYWFSWSIGAYLCECFIRGRSSRLFSMRFDLMALIAFAIHLFKPTTPFTFVAFSLLTGIAIDRLISGRWTLPENRILKTAWLHLRLVGVVSYSFYLFHQPIIGQTPKVLAKLFPAAYFHPLVKYAVCLSWYPLILGLSYILYKTIEQPSINLGKIVWEKSKRSNKTVQAKAKRAVTGL